MRKVILLAIATAMLVATAAYAHHSYGATYDTSKEVRLQGKLVQFVFRNPHAFVHIQAADQKGVMQRWAVEWSGTTQLGAAGITQNRCKSATKSSLSARPSRVPGEYRALMVNAETSVDGFGWGSREGEKVD